MILALVPSALASLPRSGSWMITLKGTLGFIELAAAIKFLSNADLVERWGVVTRTVVVMAWVILSAGLACYLFGLRIYRASPGDRQAVAGWCRGGADRHGMAGRWDLTRPPTR